MVKRFDSASLFDAMEAERLHREISWARVAEETGISASTIKRTRLGGRMEVDGMLNLVAWLDRPVEEFVYDSEV